MKHKLLLFLILLVVFIGTRIYSDFPKTKNNSQSSIASDIARDSLQIDTFIPVTETPPPLPTPSQSTACNHDNGLPAVNTGQPFDSSCSCPAFLVECRNKQCISITDQCNPPNCVQSPNQSVSCLTVGNWCADVSLVGPGNGIYCLGKPVIYLYPQKPTLVDVRVTMQQGSVVVSSPLYDVAFGGWKHVLSYPDGTLAYQGETYHELFYESAVPTVLAPKTGIVINSSELRVELTAITSELGLIKNEQEEFLAYWLPKLYDLNSPYILFSLIDADEKECIDNVEIFPKPDTMIAFLAYFKPLQVQISIEPLMLPRAQKRLGFTAVEWGGTIAN